MNCMVINCDIVCGWGGGVAVCRVVGQKALVLVCRVVKGKRGVCVWACVCRGGRGVLCV